MNTWSNALGNQGILFRLVTICNLEREQRQSRLAKLCAVTIVAYSILLSACSGGSNGASTSAGVGISSSSSVSSVGSSSSNSSSSISSALSSSSSSFSSISISSPSSYLFPTPASVTASSYFYSTTTTPQTILLSIQNPPASAKYIVWQNSSNGVSTVEGSWNTPNQATFTIYFKEGADVAPATYSDLLYVGLCETQNCSAPIANSLVAIPISYKV